MSKVCHIVGGGDFFGIRPTGEGDFIIALPIKVCCIFRISV